MSLLITEKRAILTADLNQDGGVKFVIRKLSLSLKAGKCLSHC